MNRSALFGSLAGSFILATPALAQETNSDASVPSPVQKTRPQAPTAHEGEAIIVTATRRSENIQKVPIAIQELSSQQIQAQRIEQPIDLQRAVAGLTVVNTFSDQTPIFSIRGISADDIYPNDTSPIGIYFDDVYAASPLMLVQPIFDMQRIEVLKGPQGTLYGRNTSGGAINFISRRPTNDFNGYVSAGFGSWDTLELEGAVGGPVSDNVSFRVAGTMTNQGKGYQTDLFTGREFGKIRRGGFRGQLLFQPSSTIDVLVNGHYSYDRSISPSPYSSFTYTGNPGKVTVNPDLNLHNHADQPGGNVQINAHLGGVKLTSITAYDKASRRGADNYDGLPERILDFYSDFKSNQFGQEIRLASEDRPSNFLDWIVGATYGRDKVNALILQDLSDVFYPNGENIAVLRADYTQRTRSLGLFAHAVAHVTPQLNLTLGGRYSNDRRSFVGETIDVSGGFTGTTPGGVTASRDETRTTHNFSYRLGLDDKISDRLMVYVSLATGYKMGTFYGNAASTQEAWGFTKPEKVTTAELGFKSQFFGNVLRLNAAAFYSKYTDRQSLVAVQTPFAVTSAIANIPKARSVGAEIEAVLKPVQGLTLSANGAYVDSDIQEIVTDVRGLPVVTPIRLGQALPQTPKFAYNLLARYDWRLAGRQAFAQVDYSWSDTAISALGDALAEYGPIRNLGASVGITLRNHLSARVWGRNLTNGKRHTYSFTSIFGDQLFYTQKPRSYGVALAYEF